MLVGDRYLYALYFFLPPRHRLQIKQGLWRGMRCLHCGSTLSTFKKLTDSDFCSAQHRDLFYTEQQKLILERLRTSATRFHRLRRGSTVDTVVAPPKVEEAQAPAKLAAFLYAKLEAQQRLFGLRYFLAEGFSIAVPIYPRRESSRSVNTGLFASSHSRPYLGRAITQAHIT